MLELHLRTSEKLPLASLLSCPSPRYRPKLPANKELHSDFSTGVIDRAIKTWVEGNGGQADDRRYTLAVREGRESMEGYKDT